MKTLLLLFSLNLVKLALHCYGWRTGPKPPGYLRGGDRPYWRPMPGKPNHIQAEPHPSRDLRGSHQHEHQGGTATMKERPILFSGPMVKALLAGTKTQTRRMVKREGCQCGQWEPEEMCNVTPEGWQTTGHSGRWWCQCCTSNEDAIQCPYGVPGDRLWVKETHAPMLGGGWVYAADYSAERLKQKDARGFWKPSIFCTRQASRITLEIVSVRVARLQDISEADAVAEGIEPVQMPTDEVMFLDYLEQGAMLARSVSSYATLWASINGPGSWALNPWVWVVEFQRKEPV